MMLSSLTYGFRSSRFLILGYANRATAVKPIAYPTSPSATATAATTNVVNRYIRAPISMRHRIAPQGDLRTEMPSFVCAWPTLLSLLSLLSRAIAVALTHPALARRRLKKSSIYLSWKWLPAVAVEGSIATATLSDNSDDNDNSPARHASRTVKDATLFCGWCRPTKRLHFFTGQELDCIPFNEAGALRPSPDPVVNVAGVYHCVRLHCAATLPKFIFQLCPGWIATQKRCFPNIAFHMFDDSIGSIRDVLGRDRDAAGHECFIGGRLSWRRVDVLNCRECDQHSSNHLESLPFANPYHPAAVWKSSDRVATQRRTNQA